MVPAVYDPASAAMKASTISLDTGPRASSGMPRLSQKMWKAKRPDPCPDTVPAAHDRDANWTMRPTSSSDMTALEGRAALAGRHRLRRSFAAHGGLSGDGRIVLGDGGRMGPVGASLTGKGASILCLRAGAVARDAGASFPMPRAAAGRGSLSSRGSTR